MKHCLVFFFATIIFYPVIAQQKMRYDADTLLNKRINRESVQFLWPNVIFKQGNTTVTNDSSIYYRSKNLMESYGHIKIIDDSTTITSEKLIYDGNQRTTLLTNDVVYVNGERSMYTDHLNYHLDKKIASYINGGKLVDTTNVLTSSQGVFYAQLNYAVFTGKVVLVSPEFTLESDTLRYNTATKTAYTEGNTILTNQDGTQLFADGGEFKTYVDQSQFIEGNVETEDYYLEGDELFFDDLNQYYKGIGHVLLTAKENDVIITGGEGYYDRVAGLSVIYGNPIMKRIMEQDTFYLAADTLVAIESPYDSAKRILAYPDIRIFKNNLQGLADSSAYFRADSIIMMYGDPILWTGKNQIRADSIEMHLTENTIDKMLLHQDAFLINKDTMGNFNQIKGLNMVTYFENNLIDKMDVEGNGESIFYLLDDENGLFLGMNRLLCSSMTIGFLNNDINDITVYTQPEGRIIPPHELSEEDEQLDGFKWLFEKRPLLDDIFVKPEAFDRTRKRSRSQRERSGSKTGDPNTRGPINPGKKNTDLNQLGNKG